MVRSVVIMLCAASWLVGCGPIGSDGGDGGSRDGASGARGVATLEAADAILGSVQNLLRQDERDRAIGVLASAVESYPDDQELRLAYAELLTGAGRHAEALKQRERALELGPAVPGVLFDAGAAAGFVGDWALAAERFGAVAAAAPHDARAALRHGLALRELGRGDEAIGELRRAAALDPTRAIAWGSLAQALLDRGDAAAAIERAARARSLEPGEVVWRVLEARAVRASGDPGAALLLLVGLDEGMRTEAGVLETAAELCDQLERPGVAADLHADAARGASTDAGLWLEAARWHRRAGHLEDARQAAQNAAILGSDGARALLGELREGDGGVDRP